MRGLASRFAPRNVLAIPGGGDSHITPFESDKYAHFQQLMKTALARATPEIRFEERDQSDKLAEVEAQAIANAYYINKFQQMESSLDEEYEEGFRAWLMGQSAFTANLKAKGAGACDVDGKNLTVLPGVREFCKSKEDQITEFLKRKKRLETLGPMNLEDAYYYYKYIINGEEFKPTSIYARENKKPEELIGGKYDPDWTNRNTRQPFAQAEPPSSSDSEGPGPDESRQRDVPREKRRAKKRMDKEQYIKARREQKVRITDGDNEAIEASFPEAAMGRAIKAGKGAREALIQKALPSKEPRDEMIESDSDNEGGAPPPGPPPPPPPPPGPKTPPLQPQPGPRSPRTRWPGRRRPSGAAAPAAAPPPPRRRPSHRRGPRARQRWWRPRRWPLRRQGPCSSGCPSPSRLNSQTRG
eukprot:tig00021047_g18145.t1